MAVRRHAPRLVVLGIGLVGVLGLFWLAATGLPTFGTSHHPYAERAIDASLQRQTANTVGSVTFDQRGFDTLGEEFLLFAAVLGAALILRVKPDEQRSEPRDERREGRLVAPPLDAVRLLGVVMLPVTVLFGLYVIAHGHLTPGGGFQGGVVLATAIHLVYLSGSYPALERIRPFRPFERAEAVAAVSYIVVGLLGVVAVGAFLANTLPHGRLNELASAGTVPLLNAVIGCQVAAAMIVLLAEFFEQALTVRHAGGTE
jgi:multicomponent Na+:H+ antiporter subunit B